VAVAYSIAGNPHRARLPTAVAGHTFEGTAAHNIWVGPKLEICLLRTLVVRD
jgi:hypothetical protein